MTPPLHLAIEPGEVLVIVLAGELDMSNVPATEAEIHMDREASRAVLVDLSDLTFMDSSGVAMLNRLAGQAIGLDRPLRIVAGKGTAPRRILEIVSLGIPIDDSRADAIAALDLNPPT